MPGNPYYNSAHWGKLKAEAKRRAGGMCEAPNCTRRAFIVDHIQARPRGVEEPTAWDVIGNLRCLCKMHDNQVKEKKDGTRKRDGRFYIPGSDAAGMPLDPSHPWFGGGRDGDEEDGDDLLEGE